MLAIAGGLLPAASRPLLRVVGVFLVPFFARRVIGRESIDGASLVLVVLAVKLPAVDGRGFH
jgi:hypothetical protein